MIELVTTMVLMLAAVPMRLHQAEVLAQHTIDAARSNGEDPILYAALVTRESHWDARAVSPTGAYGLSQLNPAFYPGRRTAWAQLYTGATVRRHSGGAVLLPVRALRPARTADQSGSTAVLEMEAASQAAGDGGHGC